MTLQGQSDFILGTELPLDDVLRVAGDVLARFAEEHPDVASARAEAMSRDDVQIRIVYRSGSYAALEASMDDLAGRIVDALRERESRLDVRRGATEMIPA
jgi:hypothetical protein